MEVTILGIDTNEITKHGIFEESSSFRNHESNVFFECIYLSAKKIEKSMVFQQYETKNIHSDSLVGDWELYMELGGINVPREG